MEFKTFSGNESESMF
jgi:hypothetical protein